MKNPNDQVEIKASTLMACKNVAHNFKNIVIDDPNSKQLVAVLSLLEDELDTALEIEPAKVVDFQEWLIKKGRS
jgi:arsenate reductase-like glutaredoxin family protein